jgi:hypothetical protein
LVKVGMMIGVGEERIKITVDVGVGEAVTVGWVGVTEGVRVDVGRTADVWVAAALTVCAMKVPTALASTVGTPGVAIVGTHAITRAIAVTQNNQVVLRVLAIAASFEMRSRLEGGLYCLRVSPQRSPCMDSRDRLRR